MIFVIVCHDVETHGVRLHGVRFHGVRLRGVRFHGVRLREGYCPASMVVFFVCRDVACNVSTVFTGREAADAKPPRPCGWGVKNPQKFSKIFMPLF
ncbi:MAG: hypothetical protein LBD59_12075 [Prevotellaceae bacterium]|nr:hypothetical protein [Prevotellaceae bacterium]